MTTIKRRDTGFAAYALPVARAQGLLALALWVFAMLLLTAFCAWFEALRAVAVIIFAWWIWSSFYVFRILPQNGRKMLRARGIEYSIGARNHPRLKTLLQKGSTNVGVREPEGYIQKDASDDANYNVRIAGVTPHWIAVGQGATRDLEPPELDCLALRCLVHARLGHVARLDLINRVRQMPSANRVLVWPISLYASLLHALWLAHAESNADRLALLLVKNPKLVMSALLKDFVSHHNLLRAKGVGFDDVETHLKSGGLLEKSGAQMSAQYALGNALREDAAFNARLNALTTWVNSPEYVSALETLA